MFGILDEFEMMEGEDGSTRQFELYDNISEFIGNYEDAREAKKEAATKMKLKALEKFFDDDEVPEEKPL